MVTYSKTHQSFEYYAEFYYLHIKIHALFGSLHETGSIQQTSSSVQCNGILEINGKLISEIELSDQCRKSARKPLKPYIMMWSQRRVYNIEKIARQNQKVKQQM